ncbi:hypothetical protein HYW46_02985 [Candidatus Daviesbacteria bacterium]|nr:hypothetical protein [Candidatus Daviesbacteria bacterium]
MKNDYQIVTFKDKKIRRHWDEKTEKWYFSVVDIIAKNYNLSAKNPNNTNSAVYKSPNEILINIQNSEKKVNQILSEIKDLL